MMKISQGPGQHQFRKGPVTCRHCQKPKHRQSLTPWCRKCRLAIQHQRGTEQGLAKSIWTRRLQAWLKTISQPQGKTQPPSERQGIVPQELAHLTSSAQSP